MTSEPGPSEPLLIVQLPLDGEVDRNVRADPPLSVASGRVVLDHVTPGEDGRLEPPEASEIVMSVPSPEALRRDSDEVRDAIQQAPDGDEPLMIIVEAAEYLREDELAAVLDAAAGTPRRVIVRIMADV
jgi:hypothetical protein